MRLCVCVQLCNFSGNSRAYIVADVQLLYRTYPSDMVVMIDTRRLHQIIMNGLRYALSLQHGQACMCGTDVLRAHSGYSVVVRVDPRPTPRRLSRPHHFLHLQ